MRKLVTVMVAGLIALATTVTTVSAEEYEVQSGDNLWNIAKEHKTSVDKLIELNNLKETVIYPKQVLLLYETYQVESGDALINIAKKYDVTVEQLKEWNNLDSDLIKIGQELDIKGVPQETIDEKTSKQEVETKVEVETKENEVTEEKVETKVNEVSEEEVETKEDAEVKEKEQSQSEDVQASNEEPEGKTMTVTATAYTASCEGCSGITYTGVDLIKNPDAKVIAVDPNVIPLGSEVYVEGYGYATASDIGSAIKGNKIDVFIPDLDRAIEWGNKSVNLTILN